MCFREYRRSVGNSHHTSHSSPVQRLLLPAHQQPCVLPPGAPQYAPFSPGAPPPPAHQSPRHMQYTSHPLPAHLNPVLPSPGLHPVGYPAASLVPPLTAPSFASPSLGAVYTTYPISPTKTRQYQYLYQMFAGE